MKNKNKKIPLCYPNVLARDALFVLGNDSKKAVAAALRCFFHTGRYSQIEMKCPQ